MKEGFIFIVNNNQQYLDLLDVAIDSVLTFTDKGIEVHGVNFNYCSKNPRVINKRINLQKENFNTLCLSKYTAMLNSGFDLGIYMDSDIVATQGINYLWEVGLNVKRTPIFFKHPDHPEHDPIFKRLKKIFGVKQQTQDYAHADVCVFNKQCYDFFHKVIEMMNYALDHQIMLFSGDEGLMNLGLWRENITDSCLPVYDPYHLLFETVIESNQLSHCVFHGCKDINRAKNILSILKQRNFSYEHYKL